MPTMIKGAFHHSLWLILLGVIRLSALERGDNQSCTIVIFEKILSQRLRMNGGEELRWGENASQLYLHRTEAGLSYRINSKLAVAVSYKKLYWELRAPGNNITYPPPMCSSIQHGPVRQWNNDIDEN